MVNEARNIPARGGINERTVNCASTIECRIVFANTFACMCARGASLAGIVNSCDVSVACACGSCSGICTN